MSLESKQAFVIERIYGGALEPKEWPTTLRAVAAYTNSRECLYQGYRTSARGTECLFSMSGEPAPELFDLHRRVVAEFGDIRGEYAVARSTRGKVYQDHDILSDAEIKSDPYYQEFLLPNGFRYMAMCVAHAAVGPTGSEGVGFSLQRTKRQGPVDGDVLRRFIDLVPHLCRAARLHARIAEEHVRFLEQNPLLLPASRACFVVDGRARLVQLNARADALMSRGDTVAVKSGRLCLKDARLDARLLEALGDPASTLCEVTLDTRAGRIDLEIHRLRNSAFHPIGGRLFLVIAIERGPHRLDTIRERYGLSAAEHRLLAALATDRSLASYAREHDLSIHTVRTHLKSCLAKTGTHSQLELVRMALTAPSG
jgi:DNA-binding CsgD family transcriptional regulator